LVTVKAMRPLRTSELGIWNLECVHAFQIPHS
jgi:hypothetical protein